MDPTAGLDPAALAVTLGAFFVGSFVKGAIGFGMPLVTMSLIPLVAPVEIGLATNMLMALVLNAAQLREAGLARAAIRRFWPVAAGLAAGVAAGAPLIALVDDDALRLMIGLTVLGFVALSVTGAALRIAPAAERRAGLAVGLVAGVLGALTSANGPVFVMYLAALGPDRAMFRAALGFLFISTAVFAGSGYIALGVIDLDRVGLAALCGAPAALGLVAGMRLGKRLDQRLFRAVVLAALALIGVNYVLRSSGLL